MASRWATKEELKSKLTKLNYKSEVKKSGIPMMYDNENIYVKDDENHTMVIATSGSGKVQTTMLPLLKLAIKSGESFVLHDVKGEIYKHLSGELKKRNYNSVVINLDDTKVGNGFNPLSLPYKIYKDGKLDDTIELLENIGYYFCYDDNINSQKDPYWTNASISLFVGLALYLFENAKEEEININSIISLVSDFEKLSEIVKKSNKTSVIYVNLSNIILAPTETKGSILSVFTQKMRLFASRENLLNLLSKTDFDYQNINKEKTAIFIISNNKPVSKILIPLIIEEIYYSATLNETGKRLNIVIDDFENLIPIKNFSNILTLSRSYNIKFTIYIRSILELRNAYGKEGTEVLKIVFGNIIYLLSYDIETLEDISKLCGNTLTEKGLVPLITEDELKLLDNFEAIILIPRINPIKTKLIPDFEIKWDFDKEVVPLIKNDNKDIKIFKL